MPRPTPRPRRRTSHTLARLTASALTFATLAACAANGNPDTSKSDDRSSPAKQNIETVWRDMDNTIKRPQVALNRFQLNKTGSFSQADVRALADIAVGVLRKSSSPALSKMTPDDAFEAVYSQQPTATTYDAKQNSQRLIPGHDWQWLAASRYPSKPTRPKVLKVAVDATTEQGTLDNGNPAPFLSVTVQAHLLQKIVADGHTRPIVVRRTVRVSTFKPNGGPDYWPAVWARTTPFGNDACSLFEGAQLVPLRDTKLLQLDVRNLKQSLANRAVIAEPFDNTTDAATLDEQINKNCPSKQ